MTHTHHYLKIILLIVLCNISATGVLRAQDDLLDKHVTLKIDHERLDAALKSLSREQGINFSYKSSILQKDRLVTLQVKESTLRKALALMLGDDYTFRETGNYVILRKKDLPLEPKAFKFLRTPKGEFHANPNPNLKTRLDPVPKKYSLRPNVSADLEESKQVARNIIDDLVKEKIIASRDELIWFGLDNGQFVVNGKSMPDSVHNLFRFRYIKPDGTGYYYGPVRITGRGVFFDRKDLY